MVMEHRLPLSILCDIIASKCVSVVLCLALHQEHSMSWPIRMRRKPGQYSFNKRGYFVLGKICTMYFIYLSFSISSKVKINFVVALALGVAYGCASGCRFDPGWLHIFWTDSILPMKGLSSFDQYINCKNMHNTDRC